MQYDIIGDIHGHAAELEALLSNLGYTVTEADLYVPPAQDRMAVFVGDFVDRGKGNFRVIEIARSMSEAGYAHAVMGNHDWNAGLYHTHTLVEGELVPLRPHNEKHIRQHRAFLEEMHAAPIKGREHVEWLKSLPLFLELDGVRIVHAMWDNEAIRWLRENGIIDEGNRILPERWPDVAEEGTPGFRAVAQLTKGIEVQLPQGVSYLDADGNIRTKGRLKWWVNPDEPGLSLDKVVLNTTPDAVPKIPLPDDLRNITRNVQSVGPMIFFGHYWQEGELPMVESNQAVCLDQSVANKGYLAAATVTVENGHIIDMQFSSVKSGLGQSAEVRSRTFP